MTWSWDGKEKVEVITVINLHSTSALLLQFRGYFDTFLSHFLLLLTTHTWLVLMCPIQCHLTSIVRTRIRRYKWRGSSDLMDVNSASGEPKASFAAYKKGNNSAEKDPLHSAFFFVVIFPWLAWVLPYSACVASTTATFLPYFLPLCGGGDSLPIPFNFLIYDSFD